MDQLTKEQQRALILARARARAAEAAQAAETERQDMGAVAIDAIRSIPGGLAKGITGTLGALGDLANPAESETVEGVGGEPILVKKPARQGFPTSGQLNDLASAPFGGYYQPKTKGGEYAELAASFAPAIAGGAASLPVLAGRGITRSLAPAAAVLAARDAVPENMPGTRAAAELAATLAAHGVSSAAGRTAGNLLNPKDATALAEEYLGKIARDVGATPETVLAKAIQGKGQMGAETLGPSGVAMQATLGRRSGTTGEMLANTLASRQAGAPRRVMDDFAEAAGIHPEAAQGNIDALVEAGRAKAKPFFDKAISMEGGVKSEALDALAKRPIIKKAIAQAAEDIANDGGDARRLGFVFDADGNATQISNLTAEAWDLVKKAVGQSVERDTFGKRIPDSLSPGNARISNANRSLSEAMGDAIPGYREALRESGDYLSLQSAFEAGQKHMLSSTVSAAQVRKHLAKLSPAELSAYRAGQANELFSKAQNARLAPKLLNTPAVQQKLRAALGDEKAGAFLQRVQQEMELGKSGGRMMPGTNSITSDAVFAGADMDHAANLAAIMKGAEAVGQVSTGNLMGGVMSGVNAIRHFVPDFAKSGGMNTATRNELGKLLALEPEEFAATLKRLQSQGKPNRLAELMSGL